MTCSSDTIAAISITAEREEELALSQPMFDAGLQILTRVSQSSGGLFSSIVAAVLSLRRAFSGRPFSFL